MPLYYQIGQIKTLVSGSPITILDLRAPEHIRVRQGRGDWCLPAYCVYICPLDLTRH